MLSDTFWSIQLNDFPQIAKTALKDLELFATAY